MELDDLPVFAEEVVQEMRHLLARKQFTNFIELGTAVQIDKIELDHEFVVVKYRRAEEPIDIGLPIEVSGKFGAKQEAMRILMKNLGEPLGTFRRYMSADSDGIYWWGRRAR